MQYGVERQAEKASGTDAISKKRKEFSKRLIFWEGLLVTAISASGMYIAYLAIKNSFSGALPWVTAMVTSAWGAYGVSQAFYYNKAKAENILKINKSPETSNNELMKDLN